MKGLGPRTGQKSTGRMENECGLGHAQASLDLHALVRDRVGEELVIGRAEISGPTGLRGVAQAFHLGEVVIRVVESAAAR